MSETNGRSGIPSQTTRPNSDSRPRARAQTTRLLHLDSSARGGSSFSRRLSREFVQEWLRREPEAVVTYRDLALEPMPYVTESWVTAAFTPVNQQDEASLTALAQSELLIAELEAADVLVIGAPMYNFGIPASLKAWIDQVVRIGRTFGYDGPSPIGLLHGKRAVVLATSGGDAPTYEQLGLDFRTSYLRAILGFIGISQVDVVSQSSTVAPEVDLSRASEQISALLDAHEQPSEQDVHV
jgi:FMN-dependent NADH-azoreductase